MDNYKELLMQVETEQDLFDLWTTKPSINKSYNEENKETQIVIDHSKVFIRDGVVNKKVWYCENKKKRILFVLKEAYGGEASWSLADELKIRAPWASIWKRVVEWTYGVQNTTVDKIARYEPASISMEADNEWLNQISVINIKKSGGVSSSKYEEILLYADFDKLELRKQIEIIDPEIIVCGSTFGALNLLYDNQIRTKEFYCDNWYYFTDVIGGKDRLVIDYYHPANHYPALLNYYGLINIYQQALINRK